MNGGGGGGGVGGRVMMFDAVVGVEGGGKAGVGYN